MDLETPIERVAHIGPFYQKRLKKLGIEKVRDLVFHFPRRYNDFSNIIPIAKIKLNEENCIQGKILEIKNERAFKRKMILTRAIVEDASGAIRVIWFNQPYLTNVLKKAENVCLAGKAVLRKDGTYLTNPEYEKVGASDLIHVGRIVPVYPETEKLSSRWLRYILRPLLIQLKNKIEDPIPEGIRGENRLLPIQKALFQVHFPDSMDLAKKAQQRFSFEELFFIQLYVLREKAAIAKEKAWPIPQKTELIQRFIKGLAFKLTPSQEKSVSETLKDLEKPRPMSRLLEGDVGSGKTIVAIIASLNVAKQGYQVAYMAPTEILARQHFQTFTQFLRDFNLDIGLLTAKAPHQIFGGGEISREKLLEKTRARTIDILIGTHALIQEKVKFKNLALVIVDEQHRFGVKQRAKLCQTKGPIPHLLSMTATPIPRTLALTIYGDLDLSLLTEMPKGRKEIVTRVVAPKNREKAYQFIRSQVQKRRQVFVICPRIEPMNNEQRTANNKGPASWAEVRAVKEEYEKLSKKIFPDLKVAMLHGKMPAKEKKQIMRDFKSKKIDVLVSTSVVEVGIDVPDATVMMIEGAERFGLAQLHQFRGRVGRSKYQSFCFLFTDSPSRKTHQRLRALVSTKSGFELAEKDLEIRGPGDFLGRRQWGIPDLAWESLRDLSLVKKTRRVAQEILESGPQLKKYPLLRERLEKFEKRVHLE